MKVAYIAAFAASFPSRTANSIHVMNMCNAIEKIGFNVTLFVRDLGFKSSHIKSEYGLRGRFDIVRIPSKIPKFNRVLYSFKAVKIAKNKEVDIIISRSAIVCWFASLYRINFVFDAHGPISERNFFERWCYSRILSSIYFKRMSFNSTALKEWYFNNSLLPVSAPAIVAMNGAAKPSGENIYENIHLGREGVAQIGYIGHLYAGRGVDIVLSCANILTDFDFHIIGGNDEDIKFWMDKTSSNNVYFHGFVNPGLVSAYRESCDMLLAPYQDSGVAVAGGSGDQSLYMNPIKLIEYLSSGKAIVASDIRAVRDCIPLGAAILVKANDICAWVSAIEKLCLDKDFHRKMCRASTLAFGDEYTWEARARKLLGLY